MGFSRQEYWSGLPFPSPGDLPDPGIELRFTVLQPDALTSESPGKPDRIFEKTEVLKKLARLNSMVKALALCNGPHPAECVSLWILTNPPLTYRYVSH